MFLRKIIADKNLFVLLPIISVFAFFNIWLAWPQSQSFNLQPRFDWPDETANFFWVNNFVESNQLFFAEPLNEIAVNQIHPRSFNVNNKGELVPGSFLGLILFYAVIAKTFGLDAVFFFGPLLAAFGVLPFYFIIKKFFDHKIALVSAILMIFHPAWWYYSASPFLPNALFLSTLLTSLAIIICSNRMTLPKVILSGLFFGLSFSIRPSEVVWIMSLVLIVFLFRYKKFNWSKIFSFFIATGLIFLPGLYFQYSLYGGFFSTGYDQLQSQGQGGCKLCQMAQSLFLPFGFHPIILLKNFWHHYFLRFWPLNLLAFAGFIAYALRAEKNKNLFKIYSGVLIALHIWLIMFYGNWQFADQMTVNLNILAVSYIRYWLLLYLLVLPFVAYLIVSFAQKFKKNHWLMVIFSILILLYYSGSMVLFSGNDSLLKVKERIYSYYQSAQEINQLTESDSIIIVNRKDKVIFPERKAIHTFQDLHDDSLILSFLPNLIVKAPVYYLSLAPIDNGALDENLSLILIKKVNNEYLYKIE